MTDQKQLMVVRDFEKPPNGWRFTAPTGVTIEGEFFRDLYQRVCQHYEANGLPRPYQEDIEDGACRETNPGPSKCRERPPKPVAGMLPHLTVARAEQFLRSVWSAIVDRKIVPRVEAERRYKICTEECPLATEVGGCWGGCNGVAKMADKLWAKNPLPDIPEKRWCGACGCLTRYKAWLHNSTLDRAEKEKPLYWEGCWRYQDDPSPENEDAASSSQRA